MPVGRAFTPQVKAEVIALAASGVTYSEIAEITQVPVSTVYRWSRDARALIPYGDPDPIIEKKERIKELIIELVIVKLESLIEMAKFVKDPAWLRNQDASDVAILMGVSDDKLMRILERMQNAGAQSPPSDS
jgi:transposase-like protein